MKRYRHAAAPGERACDVVLEGVVANGVISFGADLESLETLPPPALRASPPW